MANRLPPRYPDRLTKVGEAVAKKLEEAGEPVVTPYVIFRIVWRVYADGKRLYLRKKTPALEDYERIRQNLLEANVIISDSDYNLRAYRVIKLSDLPADDISCLVDPFCYISHLSAMQRYGLTNRRPDALHLSRPARRILRQMIIKRMKDDYNDEVSPQYSTFPQLKIIVHPRRVRGRKVSMFETLNPGASNAIRGSFARVSTIGQTFVDMVQQPILCGGMLHVLDVWKSHAKTHLEHVIQAIDVCHSSIAKVRAGYILEDVLAVRDGRIDKWSRFAQRGGSRLLDPTKPYEPRFSERWMMSINV